jgi:hypothetical protein
MGCLLSIFTLFYEPGPEKFSGLDNASPKKINLYCFSRREI